MFDPINARFASSCSRNGINEAAIDAIWLGATSIKVKFFRFNHREVTFKRAFTRSLNLPFSSIGAFACAITFSSSSAAKVNTPLSIHFPFFTLR
jgi:hypothetical protein